MSKRGMDFLASWVRENVNADAFINEEGPDDRPRKYALQCAGDAEDEGISRGEIEEEIGALEDYMAGAIDAAAGREVDRLSAKDD